MKRTITTLAMSALVVSGFAATGTGKVEAASGSSYKVKIKADGLRVRTGPSLKHRIVDGVNAGQTFKYLGRTGNWTKIMHKGEKRFVYSGYVKKYSVSGKSAKKASFSSSTGFMRPTSGSITQGYGNASGNTATRSITESTSVHLLEHQLKQPLPEKSSSRHIRELMVTMSWSNIK